MRIVSSRRSRICSNGSIEGPEQLTVRSGDKLDVRIVAGRVDVLASDGPPTLEVAEIGTAPLIVTYDEDERDVQRRLQGPDLGRLTGLAPSRPAQEAT